jgi:hypothetical protein
MRRIGLFPVVALAGLLAAPGAWAQARGQGRGGMMGTVSKVDATAGTLELSTRRGDTRSFTVPASAVVLRQVSAAVTDLKVGDTIAVVGLPRQIDARSVEVGVDLLPRPQFGGGRRAEAAPGGQAGRFGRMAGLRVQGTISATTPNLTLKLQDGSTVQINHSTDTRFQRLTKGTLADLKSGENVRVVTEPGGSTVTAVVVTPERAAQTRRTLRRGRTARVTTPAQ